MLFYPVCVGGRVCGCVCVGKRCGYHRAGPGGAGVYAAQHKAGGECVVGGPTAGRHVPAQRDGKNPS